MHILTVIKKKRERKNGKTRYKKGEIDRQTKIRTANSRETERE
jgi:hypothetical protein